MNIPQVVKVNRVEVYLEGYKVPFTSIQIYESENNVPSAGIYFPGSVNSLKLLPSTVVQIFADVFNKETGKTSLSLIFEGEVNSVGYNKSPAGESMVVNAISMLKRTMEANIVPADSIIMPERQAAEGLYKKNFYIKTASSDDGSSKDYPQFISTARTISDVVSKVQKSKYIQTTSDTFELKHVTSWFGLMDEIALLLNNNEDVMNGDIWEIFKYFNKYFESSDLFYGINSLSYNFGYSIFALPNPGYMNIFQLKNAMSFISTTMNGGTQLGLSFNKSLKFFQILEEIKNLFGYTYLAPASPIAAKLFYLSHSDNEYKPIRMLYMPALESGAPILTNIIFPDEVASFQFSRNMNSEITRLVTTTNMPIINNSMVGYFLPTYVTPNLDISKVVNGAINYIQTAFTPEESYRGIITKHSQLDMLILHSLAQMYEENLGTSTVISEPKEKDFKHNEVLDKVVREFAITDYLNTKYSGRSISVTTPWNPYRMAGLPGIVLLENRPSIVGVVTSISSTISPNGITTSNVVFRNCRIMNNADDGFFDFKSKEKNKDDLDSYLLPEAYLEGVTAANELIYNPTIYGFENIGKDVYTFLVKGLSASNRNFTKLSDPKNSSFGYLIWEKYKAGLTKDNFPTDVSSFSDYSILSFIRNNDGSYKDTIEVKNLEQVAKDYKYKYLLYKAIEALRTEYVHQAKIAESLNDKSRLFSWIQDITSRRLITKEEYLGFIGATQDQHNHFADCRDMVELMDKNAFYVDDIRVKYIENNNFKIESPYSKDATQKKLTDEIARKIAKLEDEIKKIQARIEELKNTKPEDLINRVLKSQKESFLAAMEAITSENQDAVVENINRWNSGNLSIEQRKEFEKFKNSIPEKIAEGNNLVKSHKDEIAKLKEQAAQYSSDEGKAKIFSAPSISDVNVALFKPYDIHRRAHVVNTFNSYKTLLDNDSNQRDFSITTGS